MKSNDIDTLAFYAFRYALGRMTYAVGETVEILIRMKGLLSDSTKYLMIKEINAAITKGEAGMSCDILDWQDLVEALQDDE